ncbi:phosphatidate phosphatase LPIN3 isoform X2 [Tachyglossus aculeatus]|nr:phosphatidate phosphatase LPIN3 isoform X2 [Tachyglossus aculeatus]
MNYVGQLAETVFVTVKELYRGLNPATLTGCIDVLVVRQPDGSFQCSPFHVRFGKLGVLRSREKVVDIEINGEPVGLHMKLGDNGEAFFVQELGGEEERVPSRLCTSPIPREHPLGLLPNPPLGSGASQASWLGEPGVASSDTPTRKKRRRRKKAKRKEEALVPDSSSDEPESLESEPSLEETQKLAPSSDSVSVYYSFTNLQSEDATVFQPKDIYPSSDGEWGLQHSLSPDYPSTPKSDSELEIKSPEPSPPGAESHMQWSWGRLPQVAKSERAELPRFSSSSTTAYLTSLGESGHMVPVLAILGSDVAPLDSQSPCPSPLSKSVPASQKGKGADLEEEEPEAVLVGAPQPRMEEGQMSCPGAVGTVKGGEDRDAEGAEPAQESVPPQASEVATTAIESPRAPESSGSIGQRVGSRGRNGSLKKSQHLGPSDIYLDDLASLDLADVALYFPKSDEELAGKACSESGSSGPIPSQAGALVDSSTDNLAEPAQEPEGPVTLSLCGGLVDRREISQEKFMKHMISYQDLADNPSVLDDPNLVVKIYKKYYNWAVAAPMILSLQAFQKTLPKGTVDKLVKEKMPKKSGRWWFSWRRKEFSAEEHSSGTEKATAEELAEGPTPSGPKTELPSSEDDSPESPVILEVLSPQVPSQTFFPTYKKSLRLSSDQIRSLNLRDGANDVTFSVTTQYQGTCRCEANIYLWNWDDQVVISDIDGTITKSDALGHILPHLGKDWTHQGIVKLYNKIHLNGYKFLYCSARAIGMADITKGYLQWVNEQGCGLPKGPILLAPSSLFSALHREVIERKPEVFKIACLTDIRNLFSPLGQPFYAAFGNRPNDAYAYRQVGLPESRIFTVNPRGELIQELTKNHKSTYERLSELVEHVFPPVAHGPSVGLVHPDFSQFCFWRDPLPAIDLEDLG